MALMPVDESQQECAVIFETRYIDTATDAELILPFVLDALKTVECGSACVVWGGSDGAQVAKGLQITAPVELAALLVSTIQKLDKLTDLEFKSNKFYSPLLDIPNGDGEALCRLIQSLNLIPPDMRMTWIDICSTRSALAISGPPDAREQHFTTTVLPSLTALLAAAPAHNFYAPLLYVAGDDGALATLIQALGLIPADMRAAWIQVDSEKYAIAVSGPVDAARKAYFKATVLPNLTALIRSLELPGFPIG